jgi:hypothetical protein
MPLFDQATLACKTNHVALRSSQETDERGMSGMWSAAILLSSQFRAPNVLQMARRLQKQEGY